MERARAPTCRGICSVRASRVILQDEMRITLPQFLVASCLALTAAMAPAQTAPAFEVASIRPAAEPHRAKVAAGIQAGQMPKIGAHIDAAKAEYTYVALKELIVLAYKVKPYQI